MDGQKCSKKFHKLALIILGIVRLYHQQQFFFKANKKIKELQKRSLAKSLKNFYDKVRKFVLGMINKKKTENLNATKNSFF